MVDLESISVVILGVLFKKVKKCFRLRVGLVLFVIGVIRGGSLREGL